jgi:L-aminoadipate-semialdehyde dehydrogenase
LAYGVDGIYCLLKDFTLSTCDNALFPLLHFVLDDLPTSTKGPELSDLNMRKVLDKSEITCKDMNTLMSLYFGYLCAVGYFEGTTPKGFPYLDMWNNANVVARSLQ